MAQFHHEAGFKETCKVGAGCFYVSTTSLLCQ